MGFSVLMYHSLYDGRWPDSFSPKYTVSSEAFRGHLRAIIDNGYQAGTMRDVELRVLGGAGFPGKYCVVTIDDGHRSGIEMAEIMESFNIRATFLLTADYCRRRPDFMDPEAIRGLMNAGFDFGAHGVTHRPLSGLTVSNLNEELRDSRKWLEDILGRQVTSMSLPAGAGGKRVAACAFSAGYRLVGTSVCGRNDIHSLPSLLRRCAVLMDHGVDDVFGMLRGSPAIRLKSLLRSAVLWLPKKFLRPAERLRGTDA